MTDRRAYIAAVCYRDKYGGEHLCPSLVWAADEQSALALVRDTIPPRAWRVRVEVEELPDIYRIEDADVTHR